MINNYEDTVWATENTITANTINTSTINGQTIYPPVIVGNQGVTITPGSYVYPTTGNTITITPGQCIYPAGNTITITPTSNYSPYSFINPVLNEFILDVNNLEEQIELINFKISKSETRFIKSMATKYSAKIVYYSDEKMICLISNNFIKFCSEVVDFNKLFLNFQQDGIKTNLVRFINEKICLRSEDIVVGFYSAKNQAYYSTEYSEHLKEFKIKDKLLNKINLEVAYSIRDNQKRIYSYQVNSSVKKALLLI